MQRPQRREDERCGHRHAARDDQRRRQGGSLQSVEDGQGPTPAGELAGDCGVGDHGRLAAGVEASPPGMEALVRSLPAIARGGAGPVLPALQVIP